MLQKSFVIISIFCLIITGCSLGPNLNNAAFRIVQTDDDIEAGSLEGIVKVKGTIQLEITPAELSDAVDWSILCLVDHSDGICAEVDQTGEVHGLKECEWPNIIAKSADGAIAYFPLKVESVDQTGKIVVDKPVSRTG